MYCAFIIIASSGMGEGWGSSVVESTTARMSLLMLGVAAVHWRYGELAAANPQASSVSRKARGCRAETRSKESSTVKT